MSKKEIKKDYTPIILNENTIKDAIYEIRGQKVMLDFDLAKIYGYETKNFNRQVKNNIDKFPDDFRFQLTKEEIECLVRCKNFTSRSWEHSNEGGRRYLPYAFTEQGIYMIMTVLKGELATKQSLALVRLFKQMKDYIVETGSLLTNTNAYLETRFSSYDKRFELMETKLDAVMKNFIDSSMHKHFLIANGQKIEADVAYRQIYSLAKSSIIIIDDYIGVKTLEHLKAANPNISIMLFSDNVARNGLTDEYINDFIFDTGINIVLKPTNNLFHDRLIIIDYKTDDEKIYLSGPSSKDAGNRISTIIELENKEIYHSIIDKMAGQL